MSKKKLNFTLLVHSLFCSFILIGFLSGCSQNRMDFYENTDTTDLSKENIGGIKIGSIEKDVTNVFGKPDSIHRSQEPDTYYLIYGKNEDVQFKIVDGVVKEYFFRTKSLPRKKVSPSGIPRQTLLRIMAKTIIRELIQEKKTTF